MENFTLKEIGAGDEILQDVLDLVWNVFSEYEAPEYSEEGIREFADYIRLENISGLMKQGKIFLLGCFDKERPVGVIAASRYHVHLMFVDKAYHRRGIAKALYQKVLERFVKESEFLRVTVNSSPYAVEVYRRLGFVPMDGEQTVNGIRFVPMAHKKDPLN